MNVKELIHELRYISRDTYRLGSPDEFQWTELIVPLLKKAADALERQTAELDEWRQNFHILYYP